MVGRFGVPVATVLFALTSSTGVAQSPCVTVPVVSATAHPNIFTLQQEQWLGEAVRDYIESRVIPVRDPALSEHLQHIVDRLAANLPEAHVPFRVQLVESSEVDGASIGGGTIYITRKLAAIAKSEDELAGVLSHEMGHIASHQFSFEFTADLQRLLHVTQLGDRADVYARFQQLIDARMEDKHPLRAKEDDAQDEADRVGIYLAAAAGYRVSAEPEFFDRAFYLEGNTGSRLGDFFGLTRPGQKRLRGMKQLIATLPATCAEQVNSPAAQAEFEAWRAKVIANRAASQEVLSADKIVKFAPRLQMELRRVRFSPDGKLLLAQDESSIYVLSRDPLKLLFRMDADGAYPALFSPDSASVSFLTQGLHSEKWEVTQHVMTAVHESVFGHDCLEGKIAPDGRTILCLWKDESDPRFSLSLLDIESGKTVFEKQHFLELPLWFLLRAGGILAREDTESIIWNTFSPDGNLFFLGVDEDKIAIDLRTRTEISVGGVLHREMTGPFAFVANDKIAATNMRDPTSSGVFSFPRGERLSKIQTPADEMVAVTNGGDHWRVLTDSLRQGPQSAEKNSGKKTAEDTPPLQPEQRLAVADLNTGSIVLATRSTALDMWLDVLATESGGGGILTGRLDGGRVVSALQLSLPPSPLGNLKSVSLSPDGKYLSYSTRDRGGVWDVATGKQIFLTGKFLDSVWSSDDKLYAAFKASGKDSFIVHRLDPSMRQDTPLPSLLEGKDSFLRFGAVLRIDQDPKGKTDTWIVNSLPEGKETWRKPVKRSGAPSLTASFGWQDFIFSSFIDSDYAKALLAGNPSLKAMAAAVKDKSRARLVEVVDAASGAPVREAVLAMPADYTGVQGVNRIGDTLLVTGQNNRTIAFSLMMQKQLWQVFGVVASIDAGSGRACMVNRKDEAIVYDMDAKEIARVRTVQTIRFAQLIDHGQQLVLLLADQSVRTVALRTITVGQNTAGTD